MNQIFITLLNAMYSVCMILTAISLCTELAQTIGAPHYVIKKPIKHFTDKKCFYHSHTIQKDLHHQNS